MSQVLEAHTQLQAQWRVLQQQWQTTRSQWDDPIQRRFEREVWQEFERVLPPMLEEMQRLNDVLSQAQRELG